MDPSARTIVIHHSADFDGLFCREIARKFLPDAELIGWDYGQPVPEVPPDARLYMLDISVEGLMDHPHLIWIDHHKSAIEKFSAQIPQGYYIDGVAACRLAWQWFTTPTARRLPGKEEFINHQVEEPWAVRLAGEYDVWDKRDPDAETFQHGLRSQDLTDDDWHALLALTPGYSPPFIKSLLESGHDIQHAKALENAEIITRFGFTVQFDGLIFLACNAIRCNSHLFTAGLRPEHDACLAFGWDAGAWRVSLYHAPGKERHDLSRIAVAHGGGGHRGACGFRVPSLPFLIPTP